jgi:hypothetical protein
LDRATYDRGVLVFALHEPESGAKSVNPEQTELERLREVLPEGVNQPVNGPRFWPARVLQAGLRLALFAGEGSAPETTGWLSGLFPLVATGVRAGAALLVAFFSRGTAESVADDNPRLEAAKRLLVVPDAAAAKEYGIKGIRFRGLSEQGGFFQRLFKGALLGAYSEGDKASNDQGVWATVFVPDVLLQAVSQAQPVSDGTLRSAAARLSYRVQAFLFGVLASQQAEKYYAGLRAGTSYAAESEPAVAAVETLQGGEARSEWLAAPHAKIGIHGAELAGLAAEYLREAVAVMGQGNAGTQELQSAWAQELSQGAEPTVATMLRAVEKARVSPNNGVAGLLQSLAQESLPLSGTKQALVGNGLAAMLVAGETAPGSSARGVESAGVQTGQEIYLMGMPATYGKLQAELARVRAGLAGNPAWALSATGLIARLDLLSSALQGVATARAGEMSLVAGSVGQQLLGEVGVLAQGAKAQLRTLGEDLTRVNHAVSTGKVKGVETDGVAMAQVQVFEVNAPVARSLTLGDVMGAKLPKDITAKTYAGERVSEQAAPAGRVWAPLLRLAAGVWSNPTLQGWALQADPLGYLQRAVGSLNDSELRTLLTQNTSPVVQAYLRYSQKPDSRLREQAFVKALLRALKAEAGNLAALEATGESSAALTAAQTGFENSMAAFSNLAGSLKVLHAQVLGTWEPGTAGAGKKVWVPNALLETGGKGAFGAYVDMLSHLAVKVDTTQLEQHRRRMFRSTAQAA